jgi:2-iminobutanoate/2-iminopropanoate deaminase
MGCLDQWHSLYAQIPTNPEGSIETGSIETQTELTFGNLAKILQTGGGILADVAQVLVYLTHREDYAKMNEVYRRHFSKPYPNRGP